MLVDKFNRRHTALRLSVTDRCNIRCFYCMPEENVQFRPRNELLTFEEYERIVRVFAGLGVNQIRLTGGEPLVRSELSKLVAMLAAVPGIDDLALTTNGILLTDQAQDLRDAGLHRLNISLDTLDEETFQQIARRPGLDRVLEGIATARRVGFDQIRLNALAIRDMTENEIVPLVEFAIEQDLELRFIEFMPLDAENRWATDRVLTGAEIKSRIEATFGELKPVERLDPSQPAVDYYLSEGRGRIGLINPVSEPFCGDCNRMRLTAEGQLRNCLFSTTEWDARELLRNEASDDDLVALIKSCLAAKLQGHGIDSDDFLKPARAMYQIGG